MLLRVTDTGIGIPADKHEAIFDPFVQVHRHFTPSTEGTGLGLAISRDLAHGMGADLRVESAVGKGSTFTLELRRRRRTSMRGAGNRGRVRVTARRFGRLMLCRPRWHVANIGRPGSPASLRSHSAIADDSPLPQLRSRG